jgi:Tfp pilus assembly protein FimT
MTAFPPIEVIRDRFPTHRSNRSSSVSKELKGFLSPSRGSAIRARRQRSGTHRAVRACADWAAMILSF